ncbi:DUF4387 domain-containing protein [Arthrobacter sp. GCM10027362]|uniref:DUF4387 domain-containing protein n=1 Tax=Arthrobacter sp. GCM10027362 TaxID=3273379 RepID=UPI00363DD78D
MAALGELAQLIRSKNAGPWTLTVDIMFPDAQTFEHVVASGAVTPAAVGPLLGVDPGLIEMFNYAPANAIKFSFPRQYPNGHPEDTDAFGGQQFAPLVDLEIPSPNAEPQQTAAAGALR